MALPAYARATRCPVLTWRMAVPGRCSAGVLLVLRLKPMVRGSATAYAPYQPVSSTASPSTN
eukprot:3940236-Rhodomonas_salina.7